jgi:EAL domain-containing protein (putative c-di-GMP-specific phosphodiesterase class I)
VRWRHPERGLIPPGDFIPVAEHSGLIGRLGDWVLREACAQLRRWRRGEEPHPPRVAVNVSAAQLEDPAMAVRLAALLDEHGLEATALELEVTESMLMRHDGQTRATLHELNELGVTLALDDFGTGYSSLSQLKHLPLHAVKIDRSFVSALAKRSADHAIVRAVLGMAHALDLRVVAEGIETEQQLALLGRMGCDYAQGYFLGRPVAPEHLA